MMQILFLTDGQYYYGIPKSSDALGSEQTERNICIMMEQENLTSKENIVELKSNIYLLSIIGEVEGHEALGERAKATKYEHILPTLARVEDNDEIDGLLILLNTVGGDVEAGLAIAEMIASMQKPTVSLVLGGGHSIGVPLAVSADYSLIVPSGTMVIHPVRTNGMFIGVAQTYRNMEKTQDRITTFVSEHSRISKQRLEELMLDTKTLVKDVGTMLEGPQAVQEGLIDEVGGIAPALKKLHALIRKYKEEKGKWQKFNAVTPTSPLYLGRFYAKIKSRKLHLRERQRNLTYVNFRSCPAGYHPGYNRISPGEQFRAPGSCSAAIEYTEQPDHSV